MNVLNSNIFFRLPFFHTYEAGNDRSELPVRSLELWQVHCVLLLRLVGWLVGDGRSV